MQNGKQAKAKKKTKKVKTINWRLFEREENELIEDAEYRQLMRTAKSLNLAI